MANYLAFGIYIGNTQDTLYPPPVDNLLNVAKPSQESQFENASGGLLDGPGNRSETLLSTLYLLHSLVQRNRKVLVYSEHGYSRAPIVAAAYLAKFHNIPLLKAIAFVSAHRPMVNPKQALVELARIAVEI